MCIWNTQDKTLSGTRCCSCTADCNVKVLNIQITRSAGGKREHNACAIFTLRLPRSCTVNRLMTLVGKRKGIVSVEEL